jgi:hypothetical protein
LVGTLDRGVDGEAPVFPTAGVTRRVHDVGGGFARDLGGRERGRRDGREGFERLRRREEALRGKGSKRMENACREVGR